MIIDVLVDFILIYFPYITILMLIILSIYKIASWLTIPMEIRWPLNPTPSTNRGMVGSILRELFTFESHFRANDVYWFIILLFHFSFIFISLHIITFISGSTIIVDPLYMSLGAEFHWFIRWLYFWYTFSGFIAATSLLYILFRRLLIREIRSITLLRDYFELLILISIIILGTYIHMFNIVPAEELLKYFSSLISLNPIRPSLNPIFILHYTLAQIYIIFFPFSKCFHLIGFFINKWMVRMGVSS